MIGIETVLFDPDKRIEKIKENSVDICFCTSDQYAPYCGVAIRSIIYNSDPDRFYDILIMEADVTEDNKEKIVSLISDSANFQIRFVDLKKGLGLINLKTWAHFSVVPCYKLLLFSDFFKNYNKMVVFDTDLICQRDVAKLYDLDIKDHLIAAADDALMQWEVALNRVVVQDVAPSMRTSDYLKDYLGLGSDEHYFNNGVLVFNLKEFRNSNAYERTLFKLRSKGYVYLEQDALNEITVGRVYRLDYNWNLVGAHKKDEICKALSGERLEKYLSACESPYIIHYAGGRKPWTHRDLPFAENFLFYAKKTIWYESILASLDMRHENGKNTSNGSAGSPTVSPNVNEKIGRREFEIVNNGKKNILIHIGDFDLRSHSTYLVQEFFNRIDTSKANYYVFFDERDLSDRPDRLQCLPSDVKCYSYLSPFQLTDEENDLYQKFLFGKDVSRNSLLDKIFERECGKMFENDPIDLFIDLSGQKPRVSLAAAFLSCPKAVLISEPESINEYTKEYDYVLVYENTPEIEELKSNTIILDKGYSRNAMDKNTEQIEKLCGV